MLILKLKNIIDERGISQAELSRATGIRPNTISVFCKDRAHSKTDSDVTLGNDLRSIPVDVLNTLCDYLGVNVQDIVEFVPDKKSGRKK